MSGLDKCPHCGASWIGDPIPKEYIDKGYYGKATHWKREIGIYDMDVDRTVAWQCPDCRKETPRSFK